MNTSGESWRNGKLPPGKILIPGSLPSTWQVEHPQCATHRAYARSLRERSSPAATGVPSGTLQRVHPSVDVGKIAALAEGARTGDRRALGAKNIKPTPGDNRRTRT